MIIRWLLLFALVAIAAFGGACASTPTNTDERENTVSSIPWARPQSWEGSGGMGGMRPPGSGGGY